MADRELNWYSTFFFLFGAIIGFADPITDLLTLVTFYRSSHTTWFAVGLVFLILPCFLYVFSEWMFRGDPIRNTCGTRTMILGFNPFSPAITRLRAFIFCCKNFGQLRRGELNRTAFLIYPNKLLLHGKQPKIAAFFEAVGEAAPQFTIQLHALIVQDKPVEIIQMVSLPLSFLSLVWSFTAFDFMLTERNTRLEKLAIVSYNFCLISSRLFAITYFVLLYKWWLIAILGLHSLANAAAELRIQPLNLKYATRREMPKQYQRLLSMCLVLWLRPWNIFTMKVWLCRLYFITHAAENIVMILVYYFLVSQYHWYSLPVTISVCIFSVLGCGLTLMYLNNSEGCFGQHRMQPQSLSTARSLLDQPRSRATLISHKNVSEQIRTSHQTNPVKTIQGNVMYISYV